jgi:hypothetical protein
MQGKIIIQRLANKSFGTVVKSKYLGTKVKSEKGEVVPVLN